MGKQRAAENCHHGPRGDATGAKVTNFALGVKGATSCTARGPTMAPSDGPRHGERLHRQRYSVSPSQGPHSPSTQYCMPTKHCATPLMEGRVILHFRSSPSSQGPTAGGGGNPASEAVSSLLLGGASSPPQPKAIRGLNSKTHRERTIGETPTAHGTRTDRILEVYRIRRVRRHGGIPAHSEASARRLCSRMVGLSRNRTGDRSTFLAKPAPIAP